MKIEGIESDDVVAVRCRKCDRRMLVFFNAPYVATPSESKHWPKHCGEKVVALEGRFRAELLEIVTCRICGNDTTKTNTKQCERCWILSSNWRSLLQQDKAKAREWLQVRMDCMKGKHQYDDEHCVICGNYGPGEVERSSCKT